MVDGADSLAAMQEHVTANDLIQQLEGDQGIRRLCQREHNIAVRPFPCYTRTRCICCCFVSNVGSLVCCSFKPTDWLTYACMYLVAHCVHAVRYGASF